jgi:hypothetical protein
VRHVRRLEHRAVEVDIGLHLTSAHREHTLAAGCRADRQVFAAMCSFAVIP